MNTFALSIETREEELEAHLLRILEVKTIEAFMNSSKAKEILFFQAICL